MSIAKLASTFAFIFCAFLANPTLASAGSLHALSAIAQKYGYQYRELGPENAIELAKPGLSVIIRPGTRLYWVNGTPDAADVAPDLQGREVYVSDVTVFALARIARSSARAENPVASARPASYSQEPMTIAVVGETGSEAIRVSGTAPPKTSIRIALYAQISRDLPTSFVNALQTVSSAAGAYAITVSIGPDFYRGSTILVYATSTSGATVTTTYVLGAPNPGIFAPSVDTVPNP